MKDEVYQERVDLTGEGCLVLNYHRVRNPNTLVKMFDKITSIYQKDAELIYYSVYQDEFQEQLSYLLDEEFQFITANDLENMLFEKQPIPEKCAMVTFDDVDISVYKNAYPFLVEHKIPFALFIITGNVGESDFNGLKLASWEQIFEMTKSGLATVGVHTHHMHYLEKRKNPPFLSKTNLKTFKRDTELSIKTMKEKFNQPSTHFAYPYGFGIAETDEILKDLGYKMIYTLEPGIVQKNDSSYKIKRVLITRGNWKDIRKWVEK